ncbi:MAG: hypothetical protein AB7K36_16900 [Chloroflexota bacterium]
MVSRTAARVVGRLGLVIGMIAWPLLVIVTLLMPPPVFASQRVATALHSASQPLPSFDTVLHGTHDDTPVLDDFSRESESDEDF